MQATQYNAACVMGLHLNCYSGVKSITVRSRVESMTVKSGVESITVRLVVKSDLESKSKSVIFALPDL